MRIRTPVRVVAVLLLLLAWGLPALAQHDHAHPPSAAAPAAAAAPAPKEDPRPWFLRGKGFREFGHQMAGIFLVAAGLLLLVQDKLAARTPTIRYFWPFCFLLPGIYLIVLSDTEIWPFGDQNLFRLLLTDAQVLQHKIFSLILLALGWIELQRVRGKITGGWARYVFPALALVGGAMLFFHPHGIGGHGTDQMAAMLRVQAQHNWFGVVGVGIALAKLLAELDWGGRAIFARAWPSLMMVLGVLLLVYRE